MSRRARESPGPAPPQLLLQQARDGPADPPFHQAPRWRCCSAAGPILGTAPSVCTKWETEGLEGYSHGGPCRQCLNTSLLFHSELRDVSSWVALEIYEDTRHTSSTYQRATAFRLPAEREQGAHAHMPHERKGENRGRSDRQDRGDPHSAPKAPSVKDLSCCSLSPP